MTKTVVYGTDGETYRYLQAILQKVKVNIIILQNRYEIYQHRQASYHCCGFSVTTRITGQIAISQRDNCHVLQYDAMNGRSSTSDRV